MLTALAILALAGGAAAAGAPPHGFVRLAAVAPTIRQDMRYAGPANFVGRVVPGYGAAECWLRREAAEALAAVEADLAPHGLGLVVFDCYRPQRAVDFFVRWSRDPAEQGRKAEHYPFVDKSRLYAGGYLASLSAHSRGVAVDVGLAQTAGGRTYRLLDMGTPFDFFDERSQTMSEFVSTEARRNRLVLRSAMARRGFRNYGREWWHFALPLAYPGVHLDVPIE
jgi:zinc D-Ala-D-Ala dipeptidase